MGCLPAQEMKTDCSKWQMSNVLIGAGQEKTTQNGSEPEGSENFLTLPIV